MRWNRWLLLVLLLALRTAPPAGAQEPVPEWARVSPAQVEAAGRLGLPVAFENEYGMRFVLIPPGTFRMGASDEQVRGFEPQILRPTGHPVTLTRPYYVQITELTWGQYRALSPTQEVLKNPDEPVVGVDWSTAVRIADALPPGPSPAGRYRLPTEAEWEHACRGGTAGDVWWGAGLERARRAANLAGALDGHAQLAPVASFEPNPYGLHDMIGNAAEWVHDGIGPLPRHAQIDPQGPPEEWLDRRNLASGYQILKGGDFTTDPTRAAAWTRTAGPHGESGRLAGAPTAGLRLVLGPPLAKPVTRRVEVRARDSLTGQRIPAPVAVGRPSEQVPSRRSADGTFDLPSDGHVWFASLEPPRGFIDWFADDDGHFLKCEACPGVQRWTLDVPLFPSVRVEGQFVGPSDLDFGTITVAVKVVDTQGFARTFEDNPLPRPLAVRVDSAGRFAIDGLPAIPRAPIRLLARGALHTGAWTSGRARLTLPAEGGLVRLAEALVLYPEAVDDLGGPGPGGTIGLGGIWSRRSLSAPAILVKAPATGTGRVRVLCLDPAGRPVADALVALGIERDPSDPNQVVALRDLAWTDLAGVALFPAVPAGTHPLELLVAGQFPASREVTIEAGREASVTLRYPAPGRISLSVQRPEGGPAAWARVFVDPRDGLEWVDLTPDGALRRLPRLDHQGRRVLEHVAPGPATVMVSFMGRIVWERVLVEPGVTHDLELVLPVDPAWGPPAGAR